MILGTAGHVDHGKTALVKALTGTDTDRLPEEQRRGMTIELGFAALDLPGVGPVGVIDVPGHERFIKAMAAGAGGIDCVVLVIAADEGVKPQTREHLDICGLLGVRRGVVALTKADLLPGLGAEWRALLESDVRAALAGSFLEGAPVVEVSARTGLNLEALRAAIAAQLLALGPARSAEGPLFLPVDRAFSTRGFGLVVTGTVLSGRVRPEDQVSVIPAHEGPLRVRGIHAHNAPQAEVAAGQRAALNLPELDTDLVHRGMAVVAYQGLRAAKSLDVELELLPSAAAPLPRRSRHLVSLGTAQPEAIVRLVELATLRPGERGFAQLRFAGPVAALPGQRFVLRRDGHTLGGGRVLTLDPPRRRAFSGPRLEQLSSRSSLQRVQALLTDAGYRGLREDELFLAAGLSPGDLATLLADVQAFVRIEDRRFVARPVFEALQQRLLSALELAHRAAPERAGVPREELRQRLGAPEPTFALALEGLLSARRVERSGEALHLPGLGQRFDPAAAKLKAELADTLARQALGPLPPAELARRQQQPEARVQALLQALAADGRLVRAGEFFFDAAAVQALELRVRAHFEAHSTLSTQAFKELTGQSRKFTIPLAEYFDRQRLTLRVGEVRTRRKS